MGGDKSITKECVSSMRMIEKFQPLDLSSNIVLFPICQIGQGHNLVNPFSFKSVFLFLLAYITTRLH